jgi:transposase
VCALQPITQTTPAATGPTDYPPPATPFQAAARHWRRTPTLESVPQAIRNDPARRAAADALGQRRRTGEDVAGPARETLAQQQMAKERRRAQIQVRSLLKAHSYKAPQGTRSWRASVGWLELLPLPVVLQQCVGCLIRMREHAATSESELLGQLHKLSNEEPYAKVVQAWTKEMKGVGWLSAIRHLLELRAVERFPRRGALPHYLGLTPSEYSTGDDVQRVTDRAM